MTGSRRSIASEVGVLVWLAGCALLACGQPPGPSAGPLHASEGFIAVPPRSAPAGSCTVTFADPAVQQTTASWDAAARTFLVGTLYYLLDLTGKVVERGAVDGQWRHVIGYDEQGGPKNFIYQWQGKEVAENSWDQRNDYDAAGRLMASERVFRAGQRTINTTYEYAGDELITIRDQESGKVSSLVWQDGRAVTRETTFASVLRSRYSRQFDGAGRVVQVDIDGAGLGVRVDGTPDVRLRWSYDAEGRIVRFERDGDTSLDTPVVDGTPDQVITFEPTCARIAVLPVELYYLETWFDRS